MIRLIGGIEIDFLLFLFSTKAVNLTLVYKNSARNADSMFYKCFKIRNLGVVSLNYTRVLLSGGLCLRRAAAKSARAASVREV